MKSATLLKDTAELRPLYDFLFRFYHYLPVGNFIAETVVKTVKRTLHPTQRRKEETLSRWISALHRDKDRLARLTDELVQWARRVLGHDKSDQAKARPQGRKEEREREEKRLSAGGAKVGPEGRGRGPPARARA